MSQEIRVMEVCIGIGLNQLFPEIVIVEIPDDEDEEFTEYEIVND